MFIDNLAFMLFVLGFVSLLTLYMTLSVFLNWRKGGKSRRMDIYSIVSGGILPLGALGVYLFISGVYSQLTWPLPGSYNILFFDPLVGLAIVLIGFALSIQARLKMHYVGLLSLLVGFMTIFYGINGYFIGLTQSPIAFVDLYLAFGVAGILAFPVSLILDLEPGRTSKHPQLWAAVLVLFWIALIAAALMSFLIGGASVSPHLTTAP